MANGDTKPAAVLAVDDAPLDHLPADEKAAFHRATAVENRMQYWKTSLLRPDAPQDLKLEARLGIDTAWAAIQRHSVKRWDMVTFMRVVDGVARAKDAAGAAAGEAVLSKLPPELVALLDPHRELLGELVEAWRRTKPGRKSKFAKCADLWKAATGIGTTSDSWKTLWKTVARR